MTHTTAWPTDPSAPTTDQVGRVEPRNRDTGRCPSESHHHSWRQTRTDLAERADQAIRYTATPHGVVSMTEEALTELLRLAGFEPAEDGKR